MKKIFLGLLLASIACAAPKLQNEDIKAGAAIDASKLADASVSNTEFQYLDGVTSSIQTQFGSKVTSISVASANGLAGSSSGGTTPSLTLSTTITGLLKGNGTAISAAVSGTDYQAAGNYITALTGDVTASGPGSSAATISANAVTNSKFRQSSGLSVVGRSANTTGDVADITAASDNQILRRSGTSIGFGSIDLSQSNAVGASILPVANGGTGIASGTSGGVPYYSSSSTIASSGALSQYQVVLGGGAGGAPNVVSGTGTTGQVLTSNGAGTNPTWQNASGGSSLAQHEIFITGGSGHGSTDTRIRRLTTTVTNAGSCITYADSATLGATFTIATGCTGIYTITYADRRAGAVTPLGISKNSSQRSTNVDSITNADRLCYFEQTADYMGICTATTYLTAGDVIRPHDHGTNDSTANFYVYFRITRVN
jgi:hypothetical protein